MKRNAIVMAVFTLAIASVAALLSAAPQPQPVPTEWQLDLTYGAPTPIVVTDATGVKRLYWYVLYTVANNTGRDRMFVPQILLYTDTGKIHRGRDLMVPAVFEAIQARHGDRFLKDLARITGPMRQGADNALEGVAIFPDFDHKARRVDLFFGGFSGETAQVDLPNPVEVEQPRNDGTTELKSVNQLVLHKNLQVTWEFPGQAEARQSVSPQRIAETWVMR